MHILQIALLSIGVTLLRATDMTEQPDPNMSCGEDKTCMASLKSRSPKRGCCHNCVSGINQINSRYPGLLQPMPEKSECKDPCPEGKDVDSDKCDFTCANPSGRRTTASFIAKHISWPPVWTMDSPINQCCKTWRIPVPFIRAIHWPPGPVLYPVWCRGRYQLTDRLFCFSKKCIPPKGKQCLKEKTCRTFLVTHWRPHPVWGHCVYWWLPAWFITYPVESHCYCAKKRSG